jgi:aspartyl-tRNA(Asn)/glutamyl-tRNA(Gln) amidotransferase subunit B
LSSTPNSHVSYFDSSLPGTQPILNPEAVLFALKTARALGMDINLNSSFDRKHYFYGDQPLGYQITQHYNPIAKRGSVQLFERDGVSRGKVIHVEQIQLEQDTGKSMYSDLEDTSRIDLNRAGVPLIEMVTEPDFEDVKEVKVFIKKFQNLVRYLGVCSGDLETGAMRIDVNVSVSGNDRVELKNLSTTSAVLGAIDYEYKRQVGLIKKGETIVQETRGWDGTKTVGLRLKENALDYRYMPDPELPLIKLQENILTDLDGVIPELPDATLLKLMDQPYNLKLKDALILTYDLKLLNYYLNLFKSTKELGIKGSLSGNWLLHELLGLFHSNNLQFSEELITVEKFTELLNLIYKDQISASSAKYLLSHIFQEASERSRALIDIVKEYDLLKIEDVKEEEIEEICKEIIDSNPKTVNNLGKKPNGIKFLIGRAMSLTQGKINVSKFESKFKELLNL